MQYMSVSHGHSTIGGIEYDGGEDKKGEDSLTSTRRINGLWRCPSLDINVSVGVKTGGSRVGSPELCV